MSDGKWLTTQEASALCGKSPVALRGWINKQLKSNNAINVKQQRGKRGNDIWLIHKSEVEKIKNENPPKELTDYGPPTLPGDYIAGLVDGEGCFHFSVHNEKKESGHGSVFRPRWRHSFTIHLADKDEPILMEAQKSFSCGKIYHYPNRGANWSASTAFTVENLEDLYKKVIPFFKKYPLRASKKEAFEIWSQAVSMLRNIKRRHRSAVGHKINIRDREEDELLALIEQMKTINTAGKGRKRIHVDKCDEENGEDA